MDVCRITNYGSKRGINFDGYSAQDVLVFEEFASQIPVEDMLSYLDIYPVYLPARYSDRVACYTQVYITTHFFNDFHFMIQMLLSGCTAH